MRKPDDANLKKTDPNGYDSHINYFNRFKCKDPYTKYLPAKAREVYDWATEWDSDNFPENYVECVAFIHMVYNVSGASLKG